MTITKYTQFVVGSALLGLLSISLPVSAQSKWNLDGEWVLGTPWFTTYSDRCEIDTGKDMDILSVRFIQNGNQFQAVTDERRDSNNTVIGSGTIEGNQLSSIEENSRYLPIYWNGIIREAHDNDVLKYTTIEGIRTCGDKQLPFVLSRPYEDISETKLDLDGEWIFKADNWFSLSRGKCEIISKENFSTPLTFTRQGNRLETIVNIPDSSTPNTVGTGYINGNTVMMVNHTPPDLPIMRAGTIKEVKKDDGSTGLEISGISTCGDKFLPFVISQKEAKNNQPIRGRY